MGEQKRKRQRFLESHPYCCFCGGETLAASIDHVPNRACFRDRHGPEGFEFPACDQCQTETRLSEIAFATIVHMVNHNPNDADAGGLNRLLSGLQNNLPELANFQFLDNFEKRRAIKKLGFERPPGTTLSDLGIVKIDASFSDHIETYIKKIVRALFYRHLERPAAPDAWLWGTWSYGKVGINDHSIKMWSNMTPIIEKGIRKNIDFGDRFRYRVNYSQELDAFATIGQFGDGLIFYGLCLRKDLADRLNPEHRRIDE